MGCSSSKPHRNPQYSTSCEYHHNNYPLDKKTQKKHQKAYKKQSKRDRRNKYAAVTTSGAITSYLGYVRY
jgi:K+-transporting ATPase c subunit